MALKLQGWAYLLLVTRLAVGSTQAEVPLASTTLQQAFSGQLTASGTISAISAGCSIVDSSITASAVGLPAAFESATVYCGLAPAQSVQFWAGLLQANPEWGQQVAASAAGVLAGLFQDPLYPAFQQQVNHVQDNGSVWRTSYDITCTAPSGGDNQLPVFLAQIPDEGNTGSQYIVLAQGTYTQSPGSAVLPEADVFPLLGPMRGSTEVMLQGEGFADGLQCRFGNQSLAYVVNATVHSPQSASCWSPAWTADQNSMVNFSATTASSGCLDGVEFAYYLEPQVMHVAPITGPRYGSFDLRVQLEESVARFADAVDDFTPMIFLKGVLDNGYDLALPANLTQDRRALLASTPMYDKPLLAGNHSVLVSLNGQQLSAKLASQDAVVLELEGPFVAFKADYLLADSPRITVEFTLEGFSSLTVSGHLALSQRRLSGVDTIIEDFIPANLSQTFVQWEPFHQGVKSVTLQLDSSQLDLLQFGAVLISLVNATNADVDEQHAFAVATQMGREQLTVGFQMQPNQVFYKDDAVSIPFEVTANTLHVPASVAYKLELTSGSLDAWLPKARQKGTVYWDLAVSNPVRISLPVNWSSVPSEAEYHMNAAIMDMWNAAVVGDVNETAAHVFGVRPGQCPPGTYRPGNDSEETAPVSVATFVPNHTSRLSALIVKGLNGTVYDLSTNFQADVSQYGVMVTEQSTNATLCVEAAHAGATIEVLDSDDNPIQKLSSAQLRSEAVLGANNQTAVNSTGLNSAGMQSMTSHVTESSTSAVCASNAYLLPLQLGQNEFDIEVAPPESLDEGQSPSSEDLLDSANRTATYSLSVVRLANPDHAKLASINITDSTQQVYAICANNSGVNSSTNSDSPALDSVQPNSTQSDVAQSDSAESDLDSSAATHVSPCAANSVLAINVSSQSKWVSFQPELMFPDVEGVRVEVNGQVLSRGGDVGADMIADTSGHSNATSRNNSNFLPAAFVLGLQPGVPLTIPVTVVAEDDVTSQRYFISVTRNVSTAVAPAAAPEESPALADLGELIVSQGADNSSDDTDDVPAPAMKTTLPPGWPLPPAQEPWCSVCPAGWATTTVDASSCTMCRPGHMAANPDSPACQPCPEGTYSSSWGSSQCSHCITGTYSPSQGSQLCSMCHANTTNLEDGSSSCPVPLVPGSNISYRYAVIVSFGIKLNGTALDDIAAKAGVNATGEQVLEWLVRADTADAFNISLGDVSVTGVQQVERRILYVNVTATLGVEMAPGATPDEVEAALDLTSLSADDPIGLLSNDPDKFFGRTTKALDVTAEPDGTPAMVSESRPQTHGHHAALKWPSIIGLCLGGMLLLFAMARLWRRRSRRVLSWLGLSRFAGFVSFTSARDLGNGADDSELGVVNAEPGPLTARHVKRVSRLPDLAAEPMFGATYEPSHGPEGAPNFKPRPQT